MHAWSERFFEAACSGFGKLVNLNEVTRNKLRLDEAFVQISTGLGSCDRLLPCKIDGYCFNVRIQEVCCMETLDFPYQVGETNSKSYSTSSDEAVRSGSFPMDAMMEGGLGSEDSGAEEVAMYAGNVRDQVPRRNDCMEKTNVLESVKVAAAINCNDHTDATCSEKEDEST